MLVKDYPQTIQDAILIEANIFKEYKNSFRSLKNKSGPVSLTDILEEIAIEIFPHNQKSNIIGPWYYTPSSFWRRVLWDGDFDYFFEQFPELKRTEVIIDDVKYII